MAGASGALLLRELAECQALLADASSGLGKEEGLSPELRLAYILISVFLTLFAGLMAGLTLGLLSLDKVDLEVIKRSGSPREVWLAERVEPVLARPHFLLATLLLCNSCAMEALPLFLDRLLNPAAAIVLSVSAILVFGEIVPQAVCKRYGLQVGAYLAGFVSFLMLLTAALTWPIGKLLDAVLGEESALFKRRELKALVSIHADPTEDGDSAPALTLDEVQVIQGALDMASKRAEAAMTPIDKVFVIPSEAEINDALLLRILEMGHSRLPVYEGDSQQNIVGLVLVKELLLVDEDAGVKIKELHLRELPFISADTMLYDVLKIFRLGRSHMACLTSPGASGHLEVVGIITIEDVLEELLQQEIVDETDQYEDNLRTVPTHTLESLQQLPPNLRQLLTRGRAGGQGGGVRPQLHVRSAAGAAAAAAASSGGSPRAVAAAAATAATSALLSPRRGAVRPPAKLPTSLSAAERAADAAADAAVAAASASQDRRSIPRRTSSSRSVRDGGKGLPLGQRRASTELRQPLLEADPEEAPLARCSGSSGSQASRRDSLPPSLADWQAHRQREVQRMLSPRPSLDQDAATQQAPLPSPFAAEPPAQAPKGGDDLV